MPQATQSQETPKRRWTATVAFLLSHHWTPKTIVIVEHNTPDGAARAAVREAKKKLVKRGLKIEGYYVNAERTRVAPGATQEVSAHA